MVEGSLDQVLKAARQLPPHQQDELIRQLRPQPLSRERLAQELTALQAAGAFDEVESLKGKFGMVGSYPDASKVETYLKSLDVGWENDFDGLV